MGRIPEGAKEIGGYKSPKITHLWPHHKSMARLFVEGLKPTEIGRITGFSLGQISRILGSPAFQIELSRLSDRADTNACEASRILLEHAPRAACVLVDDLYQEVDESEKARASRQSAAKDLLDRTGHGRGIAMGRESGGNSINLTQINVEKTKTKDLFSEIMNITNGDQETR